MSGWEKTSKPAKTDEPANKSEAKQAHQADAKAGTKRSDSDQAIVRGGGGDPRAGMYRPNAPVSPKAASADSAVNSGPAPGVATEAPANKPNLSGALSAAVASCKALSDSAIALVRDSQNHKVPDTRIAAEIAAFSSATVSIAQDLSVDVSLLWDYRSTFSVDNHTQPIPKADTEQAAHYVDKIKMYLSATINDLGIVQQHRPKVPVGVRTRDLVRALNDIELVVGLPTTDPDMIASNSLVVVHGDVIPTDSGFNDPTRELERIATAMALNWQSLVTNFSLGVDRLQLFLDTMKPDPEKYGTIKDAIWDKAKEMLIAAAAPVAGSELAAKIGITAIETILKAGRAKESAQVQADANAFKQSLRDMSNALQLAAGTPKDAAGALVANPSTTGTSAGVASDELAATLYREFQSLGGADGWKPGDKSLVGPQAHFVKELRQQKDEYKANIRTERDYEGELLTAFVRANHKERAVDPIRSPIGEPTEMDGYIEMKLALEMGTNVDLNADGGVRPLSTYHLEGEQVGTLHCLKDGASGKIADRLMEDLPHFKAADSRIPIRIKVTAANDVRRGLPEFVRNKMEIVPVIDVQGGGYIVQGPQRDLWEWFEKSCNTDIQEVLSKMTKVVG